MAMASLGLAGVGIIVAFALAALGFMKRRVPFTPWVVLPALAAGVGALGTIMGISTMMGTQGLGPAEMNSGLSDAMAADTVGRWAAALVFLVSTWAAGAAAAASAGKYKVSTWGTALVTLIGGFGSSLGLGIWASLAGLGMDAYLAVGVLFVGSLGVAVGSLFRSLDDDATRVAMLRFTSGMSLILAMSYATKGLSSGTWTSFYGGFSSAPASKFQGTLDLMLSIDNFGWVALFCGLLIGMWGFFPELGDIVNRSLVWDLGLVIVVLSALGGLRYYENTQVNQTAEVASRKVLADTYMQYGDRFVSAQVKTENAGLDANGKPKAGLLSVTYPGGFHGDVLIRDKKKGWMRTWKKDAVGWSADDTIVDANIQFTKIEGLNTVIAGGASDEMKDILPILDQAAPSSLALTMNTPNLPEQLIERQVVFTSLTKGTNADYIKGLWFDADSGNPYVGPVRWFNKAELDVKFDKERIAAFLKATGATELAVMYTPETKLRNIMKLCVAAAAQEPAVPCAIYEGTSRADVISKARAASEKPSSDTLKMKVSIDEQVATLTRDEVLAPIEWEFAAIDDCAKRSLEGLESDEAKEKYLKDLSRNPLKLDIKIGTRHQIKTVVQNDKNKLEAPEWQNCITNRLQKVVNYKKAPKVEKGPWDGFEFQSRKKYPAEKPEPTVVTLELRFKPAS